MSQFKVWDKVRDAERPEWGDGIILDVDSSQAPFVLQVVFQKVLGRESYTKKGRFHTHGPIRLVKIDAQPEQPEQGKAEAPAFKVGDKVRDIIKPERGEGEVTRVATGGRQYPIRVRFAETNCVATYTADGRELMSLSRPSLEKIETPSLKVGDKVRDLRHPEWGEGTVTHLKGAESFYPIWVDFPNEEGVMFYRHGGRIAPAREPSTQKAETSTFKVGDKVRDTRWPDFGEGKVVSIRVSSYEYPILVDYQGEYGTITYTLDGRRLATEKPCLQKVETPPLKVGDKVHDAGAPEWGHGVVAEVNEQNGVLVKYHNYRTPIRYTSEGALIPGRYPTLRQE